MVTSIIGSLARSLIGLGFPPELSPKLLAPTMSYLETQHPSIVYPRSCERPIFIFSAGWRSGSTLLQRLVASSNNTLMWGEPFGDRIPVPRLANTLGVAVKHQLQIGETNGAALPTGFFKGDSDLANEWTANLNPGFEQLLYSQFASLEALLAAPARQSGYERWGCKFVRLTGQHARFLRWLYPGCRILFLVRHPFEAWSSYKGRRWYTVFPSHRMVHPWSFFSFWESLASSFLEYSGEKLVIRYEDLINPETKGDVIERIETFIEERIDSSVFETKLRGGLEKVPTSDWERAMMRVLTKSRRYYYPSAF